MKFTFPPESRPLDGYTLKRGIARGGFGEVYYGLSDAGKEVAIKLLQQNLEVELRGIQHCLNLRHSNLVSIYDVKTDADKDHWVIMEYIAGDTLEQILLKRKSPLPLPEIETWMRGVEAGLAFLHDRGIVHRDVKPGNIFWDNGQIKIGDVGLSKFMSPSRRSAHTESVGTVYYMAPEVTYGKYGYEVDIYSCGVMLYEMLTGKLPFDGQSTGEILMKHLSEAPDLSIVPVPFRSVVEAALRKDPKQRTGTINRLFVEFQAAMQGRPLPPRPAIPLEPGPTGFAFPTGPIAGVAGRPPIPALAGFESAQAAVPASPQLAQTTLEDVSQSLVNARYRSLISQDHPTFDWWFYRSGLAVAIIWGVMSSLQSRSSFGLPSIAAIWPIIFLCLRMEPVRGSGLAWLWKSSEPIQNSPVFSAKWWIERAGILALILLSTLGVTLGMVRSPEGPNVFLLAIITGISCYLLAPSTRQRLGISVQQTWTPGSIDWEYRDYVDWSILQLRQWDQSKFGFWLQRMGLFFWVQFNLLILSESYFNYGTRGADFCATATFFLTPAMVFGWMMTRRDKVPSILQYWFRLPAGVATPTSPGAARQTTAPQTNSSNRTMPPPPPLPQKARRHSAGIALTPQSLRRIGGRQRLVDLVSSMAWALVLTLLFAAGVGFLSPLFGVPSSLNPDAAKLGLFTITTLLGAWALIITGKLTEGRSSYGRPRRFYSLIAGLIVGSAAWALSRFLMVDLLADRLRSKAAFEAIGRQPLIVENAPTLTAFLVFFGLLFFVRRWWWHTDAYRPAVFRISSVILTIAVGMVLPLIFAFPWDWAVTWAAVISCVVQLSATWVPPEYRSIAA